MVAGLQSVNQEPNQPRVHVPRHHFSDTADARMAYPPKVLEVAAESADDDLLADRAFVAALAPRRKPRPPRRPQRLASRSRHLGQCPHSTAAVSSGRKTGRKRRSRQAGPTRCRELPPRRPRSVGGHMQWAQLSDSRGPTAAVLCSRSGCSASSRRISAIVTEAMSSRSAAIGRYSSRYCQFPPVNPAAPSAARPAAQSATPPCSAPAATPARSPRCD